MSGSHSHSHRSPSPAANARAAAVERVTFTSALVNLGLSITQIAVGYMARSQALMADGLHTLSDLLSDFLVFFANRKSAADADADHPYGHRRIETAASLFLGISLFAVGVGLVWRAIDNLQNPAGFHKVHVAALWIALLTLAAKETLYRYMIRKARQWRSELMAANAWHTRADAATSLVGTIGIIGNLMGYTFMDSAAAALVGFLVVRMGWTLGYAALMELIDTSLGEEEVAAIRSTLLDTPGVAGVHELRTRKMGEQALVDAHILVEPNVSVSEGHFVAESARAQVLANHEVLDVMVHVDPEDDSQARPSSRLPDRGQLMGILTDAFGATAGADVTFHYLDGKVDADIIVPEGVAGDPSALERWTAASQELLAAGDTFRSIRLLVVLT